MNWYVRALLHGYDEDKFLIQSIKRNEEIKFFMKYDKRNKSTLFIIPQTFIYTPKQQVGKPDHINCYCIETEVVIPGD